MGAWWWVGLALFASCSDGANVRGECLNEPPPIPSSATDSLADERQRCDFAAGQRIAETVDEPAVIAAMRSKVKHVFVILRENRSYDHLLAEHHEQHDVLGEDASNPDPSTRTAVKRFHETHYCTRNPAHEWNDVHLQYNGGRLDGFVTASNASGTNTEGCVAMGYYNRDDVPIYYALADEFAVSEANFSSLLGPTVPNLLFYFFATSCNSTGNIESAVNPFFTDACRGRQTIFDILRDKASVQVYSDNRPLPASFDAAILAQYFSQRSIGDLKNDLMNPDSMAEVVFVEPNYKHLFGGTQNDEHPPSNIQDGQVFVHDVITAIRAQQALWESSVVFITWDEHGGYYDHVAPPKACAPDRHAAMPDPKPSTFDFETYGIRTPLFAISPFARKGYASTITSDHTSILRFIEAWKDVGALTDRDANAWPLLDMFDFDTLRSDIPPLPAFDKSQEARHVDSCNAATFNSCCVIGVATCGPR